MNSENSYQEYGKELEKRLRLKTLPLAVKLIKTKKEIPGTAQRPLEDYGHHLSLCQSYQKSRREGTTIAMLKEDNWCFEPVVGYGLAEPPEYFMEGHNRFPQDVESLEAGRHYAEEFPKLETGKYIGVVSAPLKAANFTPDLTMIYCDSEQLSLLLLGREYKHGYNLNCSLSSHAACVYAVVPVIQRGKCQVAIPCRGDRYSAMAEDDEMIFAVPRDKMKDLMTGLRHIKETGSEIPREYRVYPEYPLGKSYKKIAEIIGYI